MASNSTTVDLSIFNNDQSLQSKCTDFKGCIAIRRLSSSLRYYSSLKLKTSTDDQNIFTNFITEVYKYSSLIQDFHHLQKQHNHQLHDVMNHVIENGIISKCDIDSCNFSSRHYRVKYNKEHENKSDDVYLNLFCDTMDSCHYYLLHLFTAGLRVVTKTRDDNDDNIDNVEDPDDQCFDPEFARIGDIISSTRSKSERFDRVSTGNKFNIELSGKGVRNKNEDDNITYLDAVFDHLYDIKIKKDAIQRLKVYVKLQEFDTEAMDIDLQNKDQKECTMISNVCKHMKDHKECRAAVISMFTESRCMY